MLIQTKLFNILCKFYFTFFHLVKLQWYEKNDRYSTDDIFILFDELKLKTE